MNKDEYRYGRRISLIGIIGNLFVVAVEFIIGVLGRSSALIADAVHSFSDVGATFAVYVGLKFSSKPVDKNHPYGHGKIESLIALFLGLILAVTGAYLVYENIQKIQAKDYISPAWFALAAALFTIVTKEWMFRITIKAGRKLNSPSIIASAYNHRSDVYSSIGVFFGILGAYIGFPILDPVAALIVAVFIIKIAFDIGRDAIMDLSDINIPPELKNKIEKIIGECNPNLVLMNAFGRRMGTKYQVSLTVKVPPYKQTAENVCELDNLKACLGEKIPEIQGIEITSDVDIASVKQTESEFRKLVKETIEKHSDRYQHIEEQEFHFLADQQEVHFNMIVNPDLSIGEAHEITRHIEKEITSKFQEAQVIIHIEPGRKN
ncbi:cation diffusion facilitator family transporter [candidate division KSB1 bacterium]